MRRLDWAVYVACSILCAARAQQGDPAQADPYSPAIVTGQAFSAVRYSRTVRVEPNGRRAIVREGHRVLMARDREGRIYMAGQGMADKQCDLPSLGKLPVCDFWGPLLLDLRAKTIWHWTDGEIGDKEQSVQMGLRDDQFADAERFTSVLPKPPDSAEPGVTVQSLGERNFKGIRATGIRTTITRAGPDGKPASTIHEVWTSAKMHLVLRVVDGDPQGEETVSGLTAISLTPDAKLFQLPERHYLRHWGERDTRGFADADVRNLGEWLGIR